MKVAVVQMDIKIQDKAYNLGRILDRLEAAAKEGANLVVFPECALTGYCFDSPEDALPVAEPVPGAGAERIAEAAKDLDCYAVVGMLERVGREVYNAAVVIGPEGVLGSYHKVHMPFLGIDRYNAYGEEAFPVFETRYGKVGVNICFDLNFPESARTAKLRGARLLVVPTNWPAGTNTYKHVVNARGHENHMFVAVANRVGTERGCGFCGHSKIVDLWAGAQTGAGATCGAAVPFLGQALCVVQRRPDRAAAPDRRGALGHGAGRLRRPHLPQTFR